MCYSRKGPLNILPFQLIFKGSVEMREKDEVQATVKTQTLILQCLDRLDRQHQTQQLILQCLDGLEQQLYLSHCYVLYQQPLPQAFLQCPDYSSIYTAAVNTPTMGTRTMHTPTKRTLTPARIPSDPSSSKETETAESSLSLHQLKD